MFPPVIWEVALIFLLIVANGVFASAEIAIIAARRGRLQQQAEGGDRRAKMALELAQNPNRFLSTAQVGITVVGTLAAALGGAQVVETMAGWFAHAPIAFVANHGREISLAIVVIAISLLELVVGELAPKRLALRHAEALAKFFAPSMNLLSTICRPVVAILSWATDTLLFFLRAGSKEESMVSIADIEHLIDTGATEGTLEPVEQKVAREALRLGDRMVSDIMRPRVDLDALDVTTPEDEIIGAVAMAGFSRLPVYEKDLDHIIGFVHMKDLFCAQHLGRPIDLRQILHPALFVPHTLALDGLLEQFQEKQTQLAIVVDEHGGTDGMVTLEDVIEELVGEIRDEHRQDKEQEIVRRDDRSWLVDGSVQIEDLIEELELRDASVPNPGTYNTVSGLILAQLGEIPPIGARTTWHGLEFEVVDMDGQRIDRVLISRLPAPDAAVT